MPLRKRATLALPVNHALAVRSCDGGQTVRERNNLPNISGQRVCAPVASKTHGNWAVGMLVEKGYLGRASQCPVH